MSYDHVSSKCTWSWSRKAFGSETSCPQPLSPAFLAFFERGFVVPMLLEGGQVAEVFVGDFERFFVVFVALSGFQ